MPAAATSVLPLAAVPVPAPTTCLQLSENSHLGFPSFRTTPHQAWSVANSKNASGMDQCLYDSGRRTRSTGKERDQETGLDYFGFRYMSAAQGRFTSADPINLTAKRVVNPSNTLNKYIYAGNNPLLYVDPTGRDITVFYKAPDGTREGYFGHILLAATNQATGAVRFADYYPLGQKTSAFSAPAAMNAVSADRLKQGAALTIRTNPDVAQKVIDTIDALTKQTPNYWLPASNCTTVCVDLLHLAGIDLPFLPILVTPTDLWSSLYSRYSAEALAGGQLRLGLYRYQRGKDFGTAMSGFPEGTDPFYNLELLYRITEIERQREIRTRICTDDGLGNRSCSEQ